MFRVFTMIRYLIIFKITKECVSSYIFFKYHFYIYFYLQTKWRTCADRGSPLPPLTPILCYCMERLLRFMIAASCGSIPHHPRQANDVSTELVQ